MTEFYGNTPQKSEVRGFLREGENNSSENNLFKRFSRFARRIANRFTSREITSANPRIDSKSGFDELTIKVADRLLVDLNSGGFSSIAQINGTLYNPNLFTNRIKSYVVINLNGKLREVNLELEEGEEEGISIPQMYFTVRNFYKSQEEFDEARTVMNPQFELSIYRHRITREYDQRRGDDPLEQLSVRELNQQHVRYIIGPEVPQTEFQDMNPTEKSNFVEELLQAKVDPEATAILYEKIKTNSSAREENLVWNRDNSQNKINMRGLLG